MRIGIIKEGKVPTDNRTPLTPTQCHGIVDGGTHEILVQASPTRCFSDAEYSATGIPLVDDLSQADLLIGIKEVPVADLIPRKDYMFFSHTLKQQAYNRGLLRAILDNEIRMIDYEVMTDDDGRRLIAFGRYAGMVGAHNALMTYGRRTGTFSLPCMTSFQHYADARYFYRKVDLPAMKVVLTGTGRVGGGAASTLRDLGIREESVADFLKKSPKHPVFVCLSSEDYIRHKDGRPFDKSYFYTHPDEHDMHFRRYTEEADIMINGIYWDRRAPAFFTVEDMRADWFNIQVIADVSCDIAPEASIPATIRPCVIADPVYGFDPETGREVEPYQSSYVDVMAVDTLPNEIPRDASRAFGDMFIRHVLPELDKAHSPMLERATMTNGEGQLTSSFEYLRDYIKAD